MIQISTRGRYALRAMVDLAQYGAGESVLRQDIAERQEISADYVVQLFRRLKSAGLIESVKGPGGGYRLARDAATISAADVIQTVEGPFAVVHCALPGPNEEPLCHRVDCCATHLLWRQLSTTIAEFLGSVTLKDLRDQALQLVGTKIAEEAIIKL
ncbi:MAG: Rrf2 family transcriptional regulator [Anaerolineae bacterium]|nr:Rrf2 family transcriptional regulator [Anaerolineae bacterium]